MRILLYTEGVIIEHCAIQTISLDGILHIYTSSFESFQYREDKTQILKVTLDSNHPICEKEKSECIKDMFNQLYNS